MAVVYEFRCDACGERGSGVQGDYIHPDPPLGWVWRFGSSLEGPHACSRTCWDKVKMTPDGKVILHITNPPTTDYMDLTLGHTSSAAEEIAKAVPGAEVVKAFNTVFAQVLTEGPDFGNGQRVSVFVASDSERAKQTARAMAESIGFAVVDAGGLKNARYLEPLAGLNIYLGYGAGLGTSIAPTWIRKA